MSFEPNKGWGNSLGHHPQSLAGRAQMEAAQQTTTDPIGSSLARSMEQLRNDISCLDEEIHLVHMKLQDAKMLHPTPASIGGVIGSEPPSPVTLADDIFMLADRITFLRKRLQGLRENLIF